MKKLLFLTSLLTVTACHPMKFDALPNSTVLSKPPLQSKLNEIKDVNKPFDSYDSKDEKRILYRDRVEFISKKKHSVESADIKIIAEEAVFNHNAVAGKFLKDGSLVVLFEDGKLSRTDFTTNKPLTIELLDRLPDQPPRMFAENNVYWLVLVGANEIFKIVWGKNDNVAVKKIICNKVKEITNNMKILCDKKSCRIFDRNSLLEEVK